MKKNQVREKGEHMKNEKNEKTFEMVLNICGFLGLGATILGVWTFELEDLIMQGMKFMKINVEGGSFFEGSNISLAEFYELIIKFIGTMGASVTYISLYSMAIYNEIIRTFFETRLKFIFYFSLFIGVFYMLNGNYILIGVISISLFVAYMMIEIENILNRTWKVDLDGWKVDDNGICYHISSLPFEYNTPSVNKDLSLSWKQITEMVGEPVHYISEWYLIWKTDCYSSEERRISLINRTGNVIECTFKTDVFYRNRI